VWGLRVTKKEPKKNCAHKPGKGARFLARPAQEKLCKGKKVNTKGNRKKKGIRNKSGNGGGYRANLTKKRLG